MLGSPEVLSEFFFVERYTSRHARSLQVVRVFLAVGRVGLECCCWPFFYNVFASASPASHIAVDVQRTTAPNVEESVLQKQTRGVQEIGRAHV